MKKWFVVIMFIILTTSTVFAQTETRYLDVDDDGVKEKICKILCSKSASRYFYYIEIYKNGKNIFSREFFYASRGETHSSVFSNMGDYDIGKYDKNIQGLQVVLLFHDQDSGSQKIGPSDMKFKYIGYFFKYNKTKNIFECYKRRETMQKYDPFNISVYKKEIIEELLEQN